ncbi:MAG: OmpP1/FadL family transporter [bacterium]
MKSYKNLTLAISIAAALGLATQAQATNGYFSHAFSTKEAGLAGAGVATAQDTLSAATNPAAMAFVGDGWDLGVSLFAPDRKYTSVGGPAIPFAPGVITNGGFGPGSPCAAPGQQPCQLPFSIGPQSITSSNKVFAIPSFGYNKMVNDQVSVGVSVYGNGGMNTLYKGGTATLYNPQNDTIEQMPGTFGRGDAGIDLIQLFIAPTVAYKINDHASVGVSAVMAYQIFKAEGLGNFAGITSNAAKLSDNNYDNSFGVGLKVGFQAAVSDKVSLGASYQSKINMDKFNEYAGLFAEEGGFDIPSTWTIGLAFKTSDTGQILFDVQGINYTDVDSIGNTLDPILQGQCLDALNATLFAQQPSPASGPGCLGGPNGAGFGYQDMTVYKLGYEWSTSDEWTWRLGASITDQPIPESEVLFNILAPAVIKTHFTFGFTRDLGNGNEFNLAAMYAQGESVKGTNAFDPSQTIELEMDQFQLGVSYSKRY